MIHSTHTTTTTRNRPHHLRPQSDTVRVALAYRDWAGTGVSHVGLGISSSHTARTLRNHGIWAEAWPVSSAEALSQRLHQTHTHADERGDVRPTHVVLAAPWIQAKEMAALAAEFPNITFVVVSHSNVAFLAADPQAIHILRETADLQLATHNVVVAGNSTRFTDWASEAWGVHVAWLPNLYSLEETFPRPGRSWDGGLLRLGLFGAQRPYKNMLSGAAAAVDLVTRLHAHAELYISTGRNEGGNLLALKELTEDIPSLTVIETDWLAWPAFRRLIRTLDLVFQPSFTESFNIVSADCVAEGVPVVGSEAIDWLPRHWRSHADEPLDISRVAEQLLRDPHAVQDGRRALEAYVENGVIGWFRFLCPQVRHIGELREAP